MGTLVVFAVQVVACKRTPEVVAAGRKAFGEDGAVKGTEVFRRISVSMEYLSPGVHMGVQKILSNSKRELWHSMRSRRPGFSDTQCIGTVRILTYAGRKGRVAGSAAFDTPPRDYELPRNAASLVKP